jgi:hypothetical protein
MWVPRRHAIALEASTGYTKTPHHPNAAAKIEPFTIRKNMGLILANGVFKIVDKSHLGYQLLNIFCI